MRVKQWPGWFQTMMNQFNGSRMFIRKGMVELKRSQRTSLCMTSRLPSLSANTSGCRFLLQVTPTAASGPGLIPHTQSFISLSLSYWCLDFNRSENITGSHLSALFMFILWRSSNNRTIKACYCIRCCSCHQSACRASKTASVQFCLRSHKSTWSFYHKEKNHCCLSETKVSRRWMLE